MKDEKGFGVPTLIHSDGQFHQFFKDECKKVERSLLRVNTVTSSFQITDAYRNNYDLIAWKSKRENNLKKVL